MTPEQAIEWISKRLEEDLRKMPPSSERDAFEWTARTAVQVVLAKISPPPQQDTRDMDHG